MATNWEDLKVRPKPLTVRESKCAGCMYSPGALVINAAECITLHKRTFPGRVFQCHEHSGEATPVLCRGWHDAFGARLQALYPGLPVAFTSVAGKMRDFWSRVKPGEAVGA
jgi:hypothetical protein